MQSVLRKRILRDFKDNIFRYLALIFMVLLSMFLVVLVVGSAEVLTRGTEKIARDTNLEDGEFSVFVPLTTDELEGIEELDIDVEEQFYFDYRRDDKYKSTVRIFKVRDEINKIHMIEGELPEKTSEAVVEKRYSEVHSIKIGDELELGDMKYEITGIGVVSDYEAPYKSIADTSVSSDTFGMIFLTEDGYEEFKEAGISQKSEEFSYAYKLKNDAKDDDLKDYLKDIKISANQVDDKFFEEYWDKTGGVKDELDDAMDELKDGANDLYDGLDELSENNNDVNNGSEQIFEMYLESVNDSLQDMGMEGELTEKNFKKKIDEVIAKYENESVLYRVKLTNAKNQLISLKKYKDGLIDYTDAVDEIKDGSKDMKDGVKDLTNAIDDATENFDFSLSNLTAFIKQNENTRIFATKNDKMVDIYAGIAVGILILILIAYVISVFIVHSIEQESSIIGTLYAMGVRKRDLLVHYITLPVIITVLSGLAGALLASSGFAVMMVAGSSYQYFSIPHFDFYLPAYLWVYALVLPAVISVIVNVLVINSKLNKTALSLIRNEKKQGKNRSLNLKDKDFITAFRLRQMVKEIRSTSTVIMGMFISFLVMMMGLTCSALCNNISKDFEADTKYEYMYSLKYPEDEVPEDATEAYAYTCKKDIYGYTFDITILGITDDNKYFDAKPEKGQMNVVVSSAFAEKFGIKKGEEFTLTDSEKDQKYAFTADEISQYSAGFYVFMDIDSLREMMGESDDYYNVLFSDKALKIPAGRLYATTSKEDIVEGSKVFSKLMLSMVVVMVGASMIIFCVVLYLMMKVMIDRSSMNISLIKIFGYRNREVKKLYLDGNFYVISLGALVCIPLSKILMDKIFPMLISNVTCGGNFAFPWFYYVVLYVGTIVVYLIINQMLIGRINKMTPAEVLKNRE